MLEVRASDTTTRWFPHESGAEFEIAFTSQLTLDGIESEVKLYRESNDATDEDAADYQFRLMLGHMIRNWRQIRLIDPSTNEVMDDDGEGMTKCTYEAQRYLRSVRIDIYNWIQNKAVDPNNFDLDELSGDHKKKSNTSQRSGRTTRKKPVKAAKK
jgi:hypothetical protein